ncbi:MAG: hypothetical protein R6U89_07535 [Dehalococcoidia bacterium]
MVPYYEKMQEFLKTYQEYERNILKPTYEELRKYLDQLQNPEYWSRYTKFGGVATPAPVRMALIRIKSPEKVVDKILRRPEEFPDWLSSASLRKMHDTIGVRVVVYFLSQLPLVDKDLRGSNPQIIEISQEDPPEAYLSKSITRRFGLTHIQRKDKENGYSSIHYTARLARSSVPKEDRPYFEIQIRTLAQELWCELEHNLAYKPETRSNFSANRRFEILSKELEAVDEHFNLLYEELIRNQETSEYQDTDLLTSENLPAALNEVGIKCNFKDLRDILKIMTSRRVKTVGDLLALANPRRLETIRNTYISTLGRSPTELETIDTLGALHGVRSHSSEIRRIQAHIAYTESWSSIERELQQV